MGTQEVCKTCGEIPNGSKSNMFSEGCCTRCSKEICDKCMVIVNHGDQKTLEYLRVQPWAKKCKAMLIEICTDCSNELKSLGCSTGELSA